VTYPFFILRLIAEDAQLCFPLLYTIYTLRNCYSTASNIQSLKERNTCFQLWIQNRASL